ncbi:MXAN_5187 C-terminal domain-containing protein [Myxococcus fulvus]|uniref:MXAN_5187 C-terminal domain-containing protein n=1 Tax=Myxococcus fulvus TaxID=33 RepID=UPI003B9A74A4
MPPPDARQSAAKSPAAKAPADTNSSEAVIHECEVLEAELAALRNLFEQYFLGAERNPPTRAHEDFKKRVNKLKTSFIRSTAAKFRVASIHSKFLTYERLWTRTLQEIEAGTYKRDLFKARRRAEVRGASTNKDPKKGVVELTEDLSDMDFEEVEEVSRPRPVNEPPLAAAIAAAAAAASTPAAGGTPFRGTPSVASASATPSVAPVTAAPARGGIPGIAPLTPAVAPVTGTPARGLPTVTSPLGGTPARGTAAVPPGMAARPAATPAPVARPTAAPAAPRPAAPVAASAPKPAAAGSGGMSDDKLRAVYDAYVTAKRRCQEDTSKMSYESVAATLRKQVPELLKQHNAKAVEFKVVIKDGKASLKAVPK